jgi:hypothetical protein
MTTCTTETGGGIIMPDGTLICMDEAVNPAPYSTTVCTGDPVNNIWAEKTDSGYRCRLDLMTYDQVWEVLTRVPEAKADLLRITDDQCLVYLANSSKLRVDEKEENKRLMNKFNNRSLPYYKLMRGNIDGSII